MERLTKRIDDNHACFAICEKECPDGIYADNPACMCTAARAALKKLIRYERMEEQGEMMISPCKLGDTVYELCKCDDGIYRIYPMIVKSLVPYGQIKRGKNGDVCVWNIYAESDYTYMYKSFYEFGKTIFLTEQEANEVLEAVSGE